MHGVYLVDDDPLIIENLTTSVPWLDNGFEVIGSSLDPEKAIDEILALQPDVVFSDLKMPSMSGMAFIAELKRREIACECVMLSAFGTFEDARRFFLMEGFDYLLKPLQLADAELVLERLGRKLARKESLSPKVGFAPSGNPRFDELVEYVRENHAKRISLQVLAKMFNISPNYICNLFSRHYDSTLTMFVTDLRMQAAARLVSGSSCPFKEVAIECGYRDYFHFCKVFKEYFGMPPSQYRESVREQGL